MFFKENNNQSE